MRVLMFGWEFPPHISGGLGTACYGLTKGLAELNDIDITFVVPKVFGDEDLSSVELIGANNISVSKHKLQFDNIQKKIEYYEVNAPLIPYIGEEEFWKLKSGKFKKENRFVETDNEGKIDFSGTYSEGLFTEIRNYALVAEVIAREAPFDIIHAHDWLTYPSGIAAKLTTGKPLVVHVHATDFDRSGGNVNPGVYAIEREGMEMADKIIAVSNFTKKTVIEKYGIPKKKIVTIHNAVDQVENGGNNVPKKGIKDKIVTFLGRITMQKGPEYFIEAANLVLNKMNNVHFVMAGSGDMMNTMISRVAELGISDRFHFTGFLKGKDVQQMFKMTDVFVMPSVSEPFGIVPLEAMQLNVPVIISNQSGVSEVLKNVIKIDFWDTYAMADSISGLLNYSSLSHHFIEEGKAEIGNLKWINAANEVYNVYRSLIKKEL